MEIAEEEALLHRIALEEQAQQKQLFQEALKQHLALREARIQQQTSQNNQNVALPQYEPQPASQQVQDGQFAAAAGGGGWVIPQILEEQAEPTEQASFTALPAIGVGPLRVYFTNTSPTPANDTFFWDFGSGSLTSNIASPGSRLYTQTGSYTITLQETSSAGNMTTASRTITVSDPTLFAWYTPPTSRTGVGPYSASFSISNTGTAPVNTITGIFDFGDDSSTVPYTASSMTINHLYDTGSFTASFSITESSYGHVSFVELYVSASVPSVTPSFTADVATGTAPLPVTFSNTSTMQVSSYDSVTYRWDFGDGSPIYTNGTAQHEYGIGEFPVKLMVTESVYQIAAEYVLPGGITGSA